MMLDVRGRCGSVFGVAPTLAVAAFLIVLVACASSGGSRSKRSSQDQREVIAVAEALFSAMKSRDTATMRRLFHPSGQLTSIESSAPPRTITAFEFIQRIGRPGAELVERMWNPEVRVDGDLASLWAPYDFHRGGSFSHCGYDAFQMVRERSTWRIIALSYTVQLTGCDTPRSRTRRRVSHSRK